MKFINKLSFVSRVYIEILSANKLIIYDLTITTNVNKIIFIFNITIPIHLMLLRTEIQFTSSFLRVDTNIESVTCVFHPKLKSKMNNSNKSEQYQINFSNSFLKCVIEMTNLLL